MTGTISTDIERAALAYLVRGWSVIPIEPRGKRPIVAWQAFERRIAAPDEVAAWFRRTRNANVAVVTGTISGLVVLDVDPQHGGTESLAELTDRHGPLPRTIEALTGGGGVHLYFAHPGGAVRNKVGVLPGIDLRGDGGCVVAPPSMHASGRRYAWQTGRGPGDVPLAPMPGWLRVIGGGSDSAGGHAPAHWRELARNGARAGARNSTIASFTGHLLWHGVDPAVALELVLAWNRSRCEPPLPDDEVERVVASIVGLHERNDDGARGKDAGGGG